ncbi:hypothetical protein COS31_04455 [Candidatus Roizmanbacteria bacterium CG02_land_8_20_14_3_00_36_15]|uniref:Nucleotidyl transferase AbiEii/AbiGii toxin family protein n=1 Tax=Candidatus Roizmanbacteria bacterium CG_4_8_14_3_um_filter_36_10 TaxID=1974834 RepID=A0A2M8GNZ2_9BACT|nr:MAG: hypothetical protein COS51_02250 [Candidatus Roizmanbacteria bacterium CG03_land_8_20_14_0_80_36_21]PIV37421.1 MAG: hypothetical protein COS31_04455 [Candidatus Roizmanbacteria bacterium CG02_land_8_20_14_3_00_36_15]PIY70496.1 MAG: hypothetical protein COY89_00505 [Candidatus Roizmanbacteria bacterium CG_4_10_14_0_8_um_filter_36_36]PJA53310.1 MAG: hypothetical protein CO166_02385 [Candidatus Roizmanbacteria bacterium CG_4_9_14_3_um_filter_36_11]PJC82238.1 MAG: hypothetical protein CO007
MFDLKKHRHILFELITDIYRSGLGAFLGFKGGTMAYFFSGLDRFSVDLDFDLLSYDKKEKIFKELPLILSKYGKVKEKKEKKFTLFFLLNYEKEERNIKIEISKRKNNKEDYTVANFYGTDVKILKEENAFANKLLACTKRKKIAYRDFYDVYFYVKKGVFANKNIIERESGKKHKEYLGYLVRFIERNLTNKNILHGLGELINEKQKYWIKNNLKKELINRINYLIDLV